jgi:hypothetical protein
MRNSRSVIFALAFGLVAPAYALKIKDSLPLAGHVRTGTGTLRLKFQVSGFTKPASISVTAKHELRPESTTTLTAAIAQECTTTIQLPLYGVYEISAILRDSSGSIDETTFSVAAIPDNTRKKISTTSPFAMGCYLAMRFEPQQLSAVTTLASKAGVACSREELRWDICEPERGKWKWSKFDAAIDACLRRNMDVMGLLDYWGAYHDEKGTMTASAVQDFVHYASSVARRYEPGGVGVAGMPKGYGISNYEIWNEPATFWIFSPRDYGVLSSKASTAIHNALPRARTFFANADENFDARAALEMRSWTFYGISPHFYCPPRSPAEGNLFAQMKHQREWHSNRNMQLPFWITEIGWPSDAGIENQKSQANFLVQSYILALAAGYERIFWYNLVCDLPDKSASEFGLLNRHDLSPKLGYSAFAAMVHQLEGSKFKQEVRLGKNISCFIFANREKQTAMLWTDHGSGKLQANPNSETSELKVFDIDGNPIGFPVSISAEPVYLVAHSGLAGVLKKHKITGIPQFDISIHQQSPDLNPGEKLEVNLDNFMDSPLSATLRLESPNLQFDSVPVLYADRRSSATEQVEILSKLPNPENRYRVVIRSDSQSPAGGGDNSVVLTEKVANHATVKVDGDLEDWEAARPYYLDTAQKAVGIRPYMDWNLSAKYYIQWDEQNLYFAAIVKDNVHVQNDCGKGMWEGDSFQLGFRCGENHSAQDYCMGFALCPTGPAVAEWEGAAASSKEVKLIVRDQLAASAMVPAGALVYEAAIPREHLIPLEMKPGSRFRFSVLLNDNDGGGRAGWMESTPGIGTGFNPLLFDEFKLGN